MYFSKLENLFKLKCAWLGNFTLRKDKLEKWNVHGQKTYLNWNVHDQQTYLNWNVHGQINYLN